MNRLAATLLLMLLPFCILVEAEEAQEGVDALLGTVDLSEWDAWFASEQPDIPFRPSDFVRSVAGMEDPVDTENLLERAASFVLPSVKSAAGKLILFLGLGILASLLNGIHGSTETAETAQTAFRIAAACIALASVFGEIGSVYRMLNTVKSVSEHLLPVLLAFLTLGGMEHTAGLMTSSLALLSQAIVRILQEIVVPICCIGGVLVTFDVNNSGRLSTIGRLFFRAAYWILGILCAFFGILNAVRGAIAAGADGILMRTAKFAAGSIPAVGSVVSDSVETAYQCVIYVKNALGIGATVLVLLLCIKPVLNAFCARCTLRAASAITEPLSGRPYADLLRALSDTLHILMLSELAAAAMALTALAPVLSVGRVS